MNWFGFARGVIDERREPGLLKRKFLSQPQQGDDDRVKHNALALRRHRSGNAAGGFCNRH
jgi:hypothetical protein